MSETNPTSFYGGPYADESDKIEAAYRDGTLDELNPEDYTYGAREVIQQFKDKSIFELPVGDFHANSVENDAEVIHPSEDKEPVLPATPSLEDFLSK